MPMSDREQKILDELETEFRPMRPSPVATRWSAVTVTTRLTAGSVGVALGLLMLTVAMAFGGAGRIAVSVVGYLLVVGGVYTVVECVVGRREIRRLMAADERPARRYRS